MLDLVRVPVIEMGWYSELESGRGGTAERQAAEDTIVGLQIRTYDGIVTLNDWRTLRENEERTKAALFARMRPVLQATLTAAFDAGVLKDPTFAGPLQRPEYVLEKETSAAHRGARTAEYRQGRRAREQLVRHHDSLVRHDSLFGGITGTFSARPSRVGLGCVALVHLLISIGILAGLPIAGA